MIPAPDAARPALIITRGDLADLMGPADYLEAMELGFRAAAEGKAHAPPPLAVEGSGGTFHAKAASLRLDRMYVALKLNGNFPGNPAEHGLPTIQGAILLCDGENGSLLAIIDSAEVTLKRTAAATALASRHLARPDSGTILICGCGALGGALLEALRAVLPLERCFAWDRDAARAASFAERFGAVASADLGAAALQSDVIVTCTTAREPFLEPAMVRPGTFVAAVGADSPDKSEIHPELMARATVVADVLAQCREMGDLRHALAAGALRIDQVHAELAELVAGTRPGRIREEEIILFDSTGTALQDVACAALIFERLRDRPQLRTVDLAA
jgi:ornithine cyclodeaminase/alanine dehydrogenase-like protein (mu-crystallin family)